MICSSGIPASARSIGTLVPIHTNAYRTTSATNDGISGGTLRLYSSQPMTTATTIPMLTGSTEVGTWTNRSAIAIANTASTSQLSTKTKHRNISRTRPLTTVAATSAIERPFSRTLTTSAP